MRNLALFTCLFLITSCTSINQSRKVAGISRQELYTTQVNNKVLPTLFWSHYDATQRGGIYLVNADGTVKIISENPPDAAINSTIDALAKVKVGDNIDVGAKLSAVKTVAELGKRNASNYMIRDLAFRIESLKNTSGKIDPEIIEIYKKLICSAEKISIAESQNQINQSKQETLKEFTNLIKLSKDASYKDLKLDSTFFKKLGEYIEKE